MEHTEYREITDSLFAAKSQLAFFQDIFSGSKAEDFTLELSKDGTYGIYLFLMNIIDELEEVEERVKEIFKDGISEGKKRLKEVSA